VSVNTQSLSPLTQMTLHHRGVTTYVINVLYMVKLTIFVLITVNEVELIDRSGETYEFKRLYLLRMAAYELKIDLSIGSTWSILFWAKNQSSEGL
jgi:uncharacterized membrane protein